MIYAWGLVALVLALLWLVDEFRRAPMEHELWTNDWIVVTEHDVELPVTAAWSFQDIWATVSEIEALPEVVA